MTIIADTGPLIGLAKIGRLALLERFTENVLIPPVVHRELLRKPGAEAVEIDWALDWLLHVAEPEPGDSLRSDAVAHLGEGERQAIELAAFYKSEVLLYDRRPSRSPCGAAVENPDNRTRWPAVARKGERSSRGRRALARGAEKRAGYWLSDDLVALARRMAGETKRN